MRAGWGGRQEEDFISTREQGVGSGKETGATASRPDGRGRPSPRGSSGALWIVAIALAGATAALDVVLGDTSTSLIAILFCATVIGYFGPRRAWRWGLLFGVFLPLGHLVARRSGELSGVLAFLPSFIGAYLGAFLEEMVRELRGSP